MITRTPKHEKVLRIPRTALITSPESITPSPIVKVLDIKMIKSITASTTPNTQR